MKIRSKLLAVPAVLGLFLVTGVGTVSADFVCPVFSGDSAPVEHNPNLVEIGGGDWTILAGPSDGVDRPNQATNNDGTGSPGGAHSEPGEPGYTPIWNTD